MISYVVCLYHEEAFGYMAEPSLMRQHRLYGAEIIVVRHATSLYAAYEEGRQLATHPTVVYLHDDVALMDFDASVRIFDLMNRNECGLMGVVGAQKGGNQELNLPWWTNNNLVGGWCSLRDDKRLWWNYGANAQTPCELYTGTQRPEVGEVHLLDGIILCDRTNLPWLKRDGWHGYDADRCYQARGAGRTVMVGDLLVCHENQPHDEAHMVEHRARMEELREAYW